MKTSRTDGILAFDTLKPYRMAIGGDPKAERTQIICHDVNSKCEAAAYDLEQQLTVAMTNIPANDRKPADNKQLEYDKKQEDDFFNNDSPTDKQIDDQANALEMMVKLNNVVRVSMIMATFNDFLKAGVVCVQGDEPMQAHIWETISRKDKARILFRYCAFFVNPLDALRDLLQSEDSQGSEEATKE